MFERVVSPGGLRRLGAFGAAIVFAMSTLFAATGASPSAAGVVRTTRVFAGIPPLHFRLITTPEGRGQLRLQMLQNPAPLTVSTARCGQVPATTTIAANDHTVHVLPVKVPPGNCATVQLAGKAVRVTGRLWY
jgi:hypothetical protein